MGYMLADTFCWLVGHERKSRLNGASYLYTFRLLRNTTAMGTRG